MHSKINHIIGIGIMLFSVNNEMIIDTHTVVEILCADASVIKEMDS